MHRNNPCDISMSPKYHHQRRHCTPPSAAAQPYDSPMLTPSPLRQRPLFPPTMQYDDADDSLQSPYKLPALAQTYNPLYATKPQAIPADDEEGHIFLSSAASPMFTPFFATSSSQPLLTPVKQAHRTTPRSVLSPQTNTLFGLAVPQEDDKPATRVGVGTKRKSTPHATPLRPHSLTPLKLSQSKEGDSMLSFDRLAPLSAAKFNARTPQTKAETEAYLKRQTATLTRLRLSDQDALDFDGAAANDSGCELDEDDALFLNKPRISGQPVKSLAFHTSKGKEKEEVVEAVSPGGHITKRRARSRPVSAELLEQTFGSPKRSPVKPSKPSGIPTRAGGARPRHSGPVAFPSTAHRGRASPASVSSSSEAGSPRPRRRISGSLTATRPHPLPFRPPLSRIDSVSSATLFFGPAISAAPKTADSTTSSNGGSRTDTNLSASTPAPASRQLSSRPNPTNRHSYAGPGSSRNDLNLWRTFQARDVSPSPRSSPFSPHARNRSTDLEDEDMFFAGEDTSFRLNVTKHTPSPAKAALPMKHKLRDSLALSDEDEVPSMGSSLGIGGEFLNAMPKASTSVTSITSDEGLVTPGVGPDGFSGWPTGPVYINQQDTHPYGGERIDVDDFIMKTLAAASKGSNMPKKAPGTPVKKARMSYFGNERPWQSAVASKVGLRDDCEFKQMPRKSLPAAFPPMGAKGAKLSDYQPTDTEDEEEYSPSTRRCDNRYTGLGLGQPTQAKNGVPASFSRWLVRRSSSGAFSSGSDSASLSNTPTRAKGIGELIHSMRNVVVVHPTYRIGPFDIISLLTQVFNTPPSFSFERCTGQQAIDFWIVQRQLRDTEFTYDKQGG
ncbi:hypothetical protein NLJ89_g11257 [Agrocybe chaxingu]|uniref:Uncharacterized protein n=1 Tax=Agrocybe chaxingu TaxID=84603 RepID=A0A9W8JM80_9AGAR|nr:hypothetical protein NLJ89_g11257 [Agrocybe chaxingu]